MYRNKSSKEILYATIANNAIMDEIDQLANNIPDIPRVISEGLLSTKAVEDYIIYGCTWEVDSCLYEIKSNYQNKISSIAKDKLEEELVHVSRSFLLDLFVRTLFREENRGYKKYLFPEEELSFEKFHSPNAIADRIIDLFKQGR